MIDVKMEFMQTPLNKYTLGKNRGFKIEKILLMSHGGAIHDTIATVERKID